jgi:UDP-glucose 4-epimerase
MKIWVTGASGFIGNHLVRRLIEEDHEVNCFSNNSLYKEQIYNINYLDYSSIESIEKQIQISGCPDSFIHIAWGGMTEPMSEIHLSANLHNSNNLIETLFSVGLNQFLFLGSINEYGSIIGSLEESMSPEGRIINYAKGKTEVTKFGLEKAALQNKSFINIRPSYVYGSGQRSNSLINHLFESFTNGKVPVLGPCDYYRDYIYINDVVEGINKLLSINESGIVNLGSGSCVFVQEFVEIFWSTIDRDAKNLSFGKKKMMKDEPDQGESFMNISKLKKLTDWSPQYTLKDGIEDTIFDLRKS